MEHTEFAVEVCEMCLERRGGDQLMVGCASCFFELEHLRTRLAVLQLESCGESIRLEARDSDLQYEAYVNGRKTGLGDGILIATTAMSVVFWMLESVR